MSRANPPIGLGPLPTTDVVKLTIALPATLKAELDLYAELHARTWGQPVDAAALVPHMLEAFLWRDRAFRKARAEAVGKKRSSEPPT